GYFKQHGLDVTLVPHTSAKSSLLDLFNGTIQISHVTETPVVYALMDTSYIPGNYVPPFQIFADMVYSSETQKIIARKDHGISEPLDIVGKKVALFEGTSIDFFLDSFLLEHQISRNEFQTVNMNPSQQLDAILNGEIDVAITWEPYASFIQQELGENATYLDTELTYSTLCLSVTLDSYAQANQDVLVSYLNSIVAAQEFMHENPDYSRKLFAQKTGVPVNVIESIWSEIDFELSLSERMLSLIEEQARWMIRNNEADTTMQDMKHFVNFAPMEDVHPRGITVIR
ncbi:MAG: ABC transporter substrate-binding protein, partial [Balneolaceae bacterium]|nr:ABC transporter substrate-binding protein [Balneolaceae bacterium]